MTNDDDRPENPATLRRKAEELARERIDRLPEESAALSPEEVWKTLYELQVHQIELEMQNEELRSAQAEIEAARARYFDLYDLAPVGYCTLSEQGRILEGNLAIATLLGVSRSSLMKLPISRFILKEDQDIYYLFRKRLFQTSEPQECELRFVNDESGFVWTHLRGTIARAEDGAPVCRVVISDISARKRAEEENERLQAQLLQARKMESVGRLAGGVAHDFNNMLGVILGNVEFALQRVGPDDPVRSELEEVRGAAQRSANLTAQLLAFARKQVVTRKVLDLNDTVGGGLQFLQRLIGQAIHLQWRPGPGLWPIEMDPSQIDQILTNLCVNARDAIAGAGKITIATRNTTLDAGYCAQHGDCSPGDYVALTVRDDGCGMDARTLSRVFEPFFTTKEIGKGTGLGLATVYGVVRQNGGSIKVLSEPGQGSTFSIYIPRHTTTVNVLRASPKVG